MTCTFQLILIVMIFHSYVTASSLITHAAWAPRLCRRLPSCSERRGQKLPNSTYWWRRSKKKYNLFVLLDPLNNINKMNAKASERELFVAMCRGALASRMLLALVCDPKPQTCTGASIADSEVSCRPKIIHLNSSFYQIAVLVCLPQLHALLSQYLDAACSLLFELLLLGHEVSFDSNRKGRFQSWSCKILTFSFQASRSPYADNFLCVGWILRVLQHHPHTVSTIITLPFFFADYTKNNVLYNRSNIKYKHY